MGERTSGGEEAFAARQKKRTVTSPQGRGEGQNKVGESQSLPRLTAQGAAATIKEEKGRRERDRLRDKRRHFYFSK